jgi:DNA-binding transcriptional LysR family regulator
MQTELLQVFREVAYRQSITGAAHALQFTQSTVSRQMAALETEFGARLFDRLPRGIVLTEEGRALLGHAEVVLARLKDAYRDVDDINNASRGRLRIAAFATAVPRALARLKLAYPGVEPTLTEGLSPRLVDRLLADECDLAVISRAADRPLDDSRLQLHHLLDEPMLVAVPLGHPLADTGTVRLSALAEEAWIAGGATPEESLLAAGMRQGFRPRIDFVAHEWLGKLGLVAAGFGITLMPALAARAAPADIVLLRLPGDEMPPRKVYAATVAGRTRSAPTEAFLAALKAEAPHLS